MCAVGTTLYVDMLAWLMKSLATFQAQFGLSLSQLPTSCRLPRVFLTRKKERSMSLLVHELLVIVRFTRAHGHGKNNAFVVTAIAGYYPLYQRHDGCAASPRKAPSALYW